MLSAFVGHMVPKEYCDTKISMETNMSLLIPTWGQNGGIAATAVIYCMCAFQNEFLEKFAEIYEPG